MAETESLDSAVHALSRRFLADYPREAARRLERLPEAEVVELLSGLPQDIMVRVWDALAPGLAGAILPLMPDAAVTRLLSGLEHHNAAKLLGMLGEDEQKHYLSLLDDGAAAELRDMLSYPRGTAGRLMDTQTFPLHGHLSIGETLQLLRRRRSRQMRSVKIVDDDNRLRAIADIRDLALADPAQPLESVSHPVVATVNAMDPRDEVVAKLEAHDLDELCVVDLDGHLLGVIRHAELIDALKREATLDIQTMVGASKDERALSTSWFAVRKRMPWLQINLLTAFLAAAVVGIFESTIAKVTALAVLLPVVAGQSGNAGAQALAVTMRGLALREIRVSHWLNIMRKEMNAGFWNGIGIAVTCATGVYIWSGSIGLVLVIAVSMVISMVMAGIAGALVPITLARLGQDPAVASSIILTTVTDIAGFFSFLGIATLLMGTLA